MSLSASIHFRKCTVIVVPKWDLFMTGLKALRFPQPLCFEKAAACRCAVSGKVRAILTNLSQARAPKRENSPGMKFGTSGSMASLERRTP